MELGSKIKYLRSKAGLTQEQLGNALGVSPQSVSKWEMDQALPQIDKALAICKLFTLCGLSLRSSCFSNFDIHNYTSINLIHLLIFALKNLNDVDGVSGIIDSGISSLLALSLLFL